MAVEMFIFNGQQFTPAEYQLFQQEHPELFTPVTPEVALATRKQQKLQELQLACVRDQQAGVITSLGIRMAYEEKDIAAVDGIARYAERKQLEKIPLIVTSDNVPYQNRFSPAQGYALVEDMFAAKLSAYCKFNELAALAASAKTQEELDAITWK